ncbi:Catenin-beta-like protein [Delphinella strobiligena]|nr:Catenin-beta-like protein [Delphinella strobiligena]
MTSIDELFKKPFLPSSNVAPGNNKRKYEASDAQSAYKSTKLSPGSDAKSKSNGQTYVQGDEEEEEDGEAGPELPPDEEEDAADDEEGRFFGGGVTKDTTAAMDFIDRADGEDYVAEKIDATWLRRLAVSFERKISKNSELRAKYENDPSKFMASEADLDAEIKSLSILSEHPDLYPEFAKIGCAASLVSLLAHENTDIAIDAIEIISELTDEDVAAGSEQWDTIVTGLLENDLINLIVQNFDRFDESLESDRGGIYHALSILENLASSPDIAGKIGGNEVLKYLLARIKVKETPVSQNKQYAAEVLQVMLQSSSEVRGNFIKANGVDSLLTLLASYRKRDPENDSTEEEYAEDLFDALTVTLSLPAGKKALSDAEGVELLLIMVKEGRFSRTRALKVLDHAMAGSSDESREVAEKVVEVGGLKSTFSTFMKKKGKDKQAIEHLIGIFSAFLRLLPGESSHRIRVLAKFVEKSFEKLAKLVTLRFEYAARVRAATEQMAAEKAQLSREELEELEEDRFSRLMDAGLYCSQTLDVILAWLVAEDAGAKNKIVELLSDKDEGLGDLKKGLEEQLAGVDVDEEGNAGEMLQALIECLA